MKAKYKTHNLTPTASEKITDIKIQASILDDLIAALPNCSEQTAALQRLEEAVMWAGKAVASHQYQI